LYAKVHKIMNGRQARLPCLAPGNVSPVEGIDDVLIFYYETSYGIYNDMVHVLFPDSPDVDAESSDALVLVVRPSSPKEKHDAGGGR
jgi:hypothetical protein